mmetsp:Transcript_2205/g.4279  ORF Transcript_2205/g.4279 Transcript_2205/m.4279 type:complete len:232 (-) Transcript_2205:165-860(-)
MISVQTTSWSVQTTWCTYSGQATITRTTMATTTARAPTTRTGTTSCSFPNRAMQHPWPTMDPTCSTWRGNGILTPLRSLAARGTRRSGPSRQRSSSRPVARPRTKSITTRTRRTARSSTPPPRRSISAWPCSSLASISTCLRATTISPTVPRRPRSKWWRQSAWHRAGPRTWWWRRSIRGRDRRWARSRSSGLRRARARRVSASTARSIGAAPRATSWWLTTRSLTRSTVG